MTLDDMGYGTTGVEGCSVPGITPPIDKLASEGLDDFLLYLQLSRLG